MILSSGGGRREESLAPLIFPEIAYITAFQADAFLKTRPDKPLSENVQRKKWSKPPVGALKLNSDGSFYSEEKTGGWGFVIRDDNGGVIKAAAGKETCVLDAFHAELLGVQAGLRMVASLGISRLHIETDATLVKEAVEGDEYRLSAMGGIVTEINYLLSSELLFSSINVCPRACNKVAHMLASIGCKNPSESVLT